MKVSSSQKNGSGGSPPRLDSTVINQPENFPYQVTDNKNTIEIRKFERPPIRGNQVKRKKLKPLIPSERSDEYKERNAFRAKNEIRRLVHRNFEKNCKFITLTFRDTDTLDIRNVDECHKKFTAFIRRIKRRYGDVKYIAVPEFQDKNGRGAVHFHLVTDLPFIEKEKLAEIWGYGFVQINKINAVTIAANYIAKYMTKYSYDNRFNGRRKYYPSRNLKKSKTYYGLEAMKIAEKFLKSDLRPTYQNSYYSEFHGKIEFTEYSKELSHPVVLSKI